MGMHLRDAGNGQQPRPHGEVGDVAQFHRPTTGASGSVETAISTTCPMIELIGPICGSDVPAGNWLRTSVSRSATCWRLRIDARCPSRTRHRRSTGRRPRRRAHARDARQAVHLHFKRIGDELLDLGRRQPLRLAHDGDGGPVQVREHVHRQARGCKQRRYTMRTAASASTRRRLRSDCVTRKVNIAQRT